VVGLNVVSLGHGLVEHCLVVISNLVPVGHGLVEHIPVFGSYVAPELHAGFSLVGGGRHTVGGS